MDTENQGNIETDDGNKSESLTSSAESESFDTWTLVTDSKAKSVPKTQLTPEKTDNEKKPEEKLDLLEVPDIRYHDNDHSGDEFSDGISIISESESAGRFSPHPMLRQHLSDLNFKLMNNQNGTDFENCKNDDYEPVTPPKTPNKLRESFSQTYRHQEIDTIEDISAHYDNEISTVDGIFRPLVRTGFTSLFYVLVCLAVLGFIGKLQYPEWQPLSLQNEIAPLTQRVGDLELQNNLLRAEIDILTKQVNYLNQQAQSRGGGNEKYTKSSTESAKSNGKYEKQKKPVEEEKLKVWTGNGNRVKQVEIPKKALKTPYSCEENEEDIAGFCIENTPVPSEDVIAEDNSDSFLGDQLKEMRKQAEILKNIKNGLFEDIDKDSVQESTGTEETPKPKKAANKLEEVAEFLDRERMEAEKQNGNNREYRNGFEKKDDKKWQQDDYRGSEGKNYPRKDDDYKKHNGKYQKNERNYEKRDNNDSAERKRQQFKKQKHFDDDDADDDSNEKYHKSEHVQKKLNNNNHSGENFRRTDDNYKKFEKKPNGGDWHEKLMQNRENTRKQNERYKNNENWYIERGNSREEARYFEKRDEPAKHKDARRR